MPSEARSETPDTGSHRPPQRRGARRKLWTTLAILVLPFGLVGLHVKAYRTFSPVDERQHVDYLYRISRGELLRMGERIGQEALRDEACRGLDWNLFTPPPCHPKRPYNPDVYPDLAYNSAHVHPPTYYFLTNMVSKTFQAAGIARDFVSSARLSGGLWLGLALLLFWYAAGQLHVSIIGRAIAMVLLATTPVILHASSTVNPDSTALLSGALVLWATLLWEQKRGRTILLLPLSAALAVALKTTNILVVGASALYLLFRWWLRRKRPSSEPRRGGGSYVAAALVVSIAGIVTATLWIVVHSLLIRVAFDPQLQQFQVASLSVDAVLSQLLALVTPLKDVWLPPFLNNTPVRAILELVNLALLAGVFGALLYERPHRPRTAIALSGGLVILSSGMALTLINYYLNSGTFITIPPRYGLSVLPFLFLALASALRRPAVSWTVGLLAVVSLGTVIIGMISAL